MSLRPGDLPGPGTRPGTESTAMMTPSRFRRVPMRPRDPDESGRSASTPELFFDLVLVVAVSIASVHLHHALRAAAST